MPRKKQPSKLVKKPDKPVRPSAKERQLAGMQEAERNLPKPLRGIFQSHRSFFFLLAKRHPQVPVELLYDACFHYSIDHWEGHQPGKGLQLATYVTNGWKNAIRMTVYQFSGDWLQNRMQPLYLSNANNRPAKELTPAQIVAERELREQQQRELRMLPQNIKQLPPRIQEIIKMRFEVWPYKRTYSLKEVATGLGIRAVGLVNFKKKACNAYAYYLTCVKKHLG